MASKVLPTLLGGLATGVIGGLAEKAIKGSGLHLSKKGCGVSQIHLVESGELYLSPLFQPPEDDHDGLYLRHGDEVYGAGLILGKDPSFKDIPILDWLS